MLLFILDEDELKSQELAGKTILLSYIICALRILVVAHLNCLFTSRMVSFKFFLLSGFVTRSTVRSSCSLTFLSL